jgi:dienelactone hydrolase
MKTNLLKYFVLFLVLIGLNTNAQQIRYIDDIFDSVTVTSNVIYGQNITILPTLAGAAMNPPVTIPPAMQPLACDVYEPKNDTLTERPVIVLIHTGSFLPPIINGQATGSKTDSSIVENCMRWAKKGYVAVAMTYRQGWAPTSTSLAVRTSTILQAAYRGIHDSKAMVRYLRKSADADGNPYGIDESKIVVGGQGTGGYLSMGYSTLDTISELLIYPKFWDTSDPDPANHTPLIIPDLGVPGPVTIGFGNLDGSDDTYWPANAAPFFFDTLTQLNFANNPSYSNDINMVFNLGGTLADLSWLDGFQVPHVSFHCENDPFASIDEGVIIVPTTGDIVIPDVVGSRVANHYNTKWGNNSGFNSPGLNDTLSQMANAYNSNWSNSLNDGSLVYDGLYVFNTPAPDTAMNMFGMRGEHESAPWDWWDNTLYGIIADSINGIPGVTSPAYFEADAINDAPYMSASYARLHLDTIHNYLNPRIYEVLFGGSTVDFNEIIEKSTQIYPNPAKDNLNIVSYAKLINSVEVYNLSGQKVLSKKVNATTTRLKTNNLSKGVYIVNVKTNVSSVKKKIIIE